MRKGNWNPWSKGLTKESDIRIKITSEKISKSLKGRKQTKEHEV